jgi:hypothetical protein
MNNETTWINQADFEANLIQEREWLTAQLAKKSHVKELFEAYQVAGNKCERLLFSESCFIWCPWTCTDC